MSMLTWEMASTFAIEAKASGDEADAAYWENMSKRIKEATWVLSEDGKSMTNAATGATQPCP